MREMHRACGNRLVAQDDQQLTQEVLTHAHEVHPEMGLTEEQAKEMVASQASDTEQATSRSLKLCSRDRFNAGPGILTRVLAFLLLLST
jgi:predicted small metal-binding protein